MESIQFSRVRLGVVVAVLCGVALGVTGSFRGRVIDGPAGKVAPGWLYVESRNHMVRKVEISRATVVYGESIPQEQRAEPAHRALIKGAEVRVTAEQGHDGEWSASAIEILQLSPGRQLRSKAGSLLPKTGNNYKNKLSLASSERLIK